MMGGRGPPMSRLVKQKNMNFLLPSDLFINLSEGSLVYLDQ